MSVCSFCFLKRIFVFPIHREELLKRLRLTRGIPELISTTVHYLLLLLVFLFAVNAGGVALNKFTVLTGALGVGVGFGLQNIINNFVSGLILQFERLSFIKTSYTRNINDLPQNSIGNVPVSF